MAQRQELKGFMKHHGKSIRPGLTNHLNSDMYVYVNGKVKPATFEIRKATAVCIKVVISFVMYGI